jgi:hypothetical protein
MWEVNKEIGQPPHKVRYVLSSAMLLPVDQVAEHIGGNRAESNRGLEPHLTREKYHHAHGFVANPTYHSHPPGKAGAFRFEILNERSLITRDGVLGGARKRMLSSRAKQGAEATVSQLRALEETYIRSRYAVNMDNLKDEGVWFAQNCRKRGDKVRGGV